MSEYQSLINEYMGNILSFKDEAIKYCILDCISLHQVLIKFTELIYSEFNINESFFCLVLINDSSKLIIKNCFNYPYNKSIKLVN